MKDRGERIPALTAYDYTSAQIVDAAGVPLILVGDSLGMVVLGYETTIPVTLEDMLHHTRAVVRGARSALVVGDLPFLTYQVTREQALANAGRMLAEAGCKAVKLEGGAEVAPTVRRLVEAGIPVLGHIGYTPQSANRFGRGRVQGKNLERGLELARDALALEEAGAFAIVLELVPRQLAAELTRRLRIPTIGIGAGPECDGEIQIFHDVFGLYRDFCPRHTKRYADLSQILGAAAQKFAAEVRAREFPGEAQETSMDGEVMGQIRSLLDRELSIKPKAVLG
jgi:3-methyl-2-oxobutanoate hydroxymethyltransferase